MTPNEQLAVDALRKWARMFLVGWHDVAVADTVTDTEKFFSAVGLDWQKEAETLEQELLAMRYADEPKTITPEEEEALRRETEDLRAAGKLRDPAHIIRGSIVVAKDEDEGDFTEAEIKR